jgi:uncharacterized protein
MVIFYLALDHWFSRPLSFRPDPYDEYSLSIEAALMLAQVCQITFLWLLAHWRGYSARDLWSRLLHVPVIVWLLVFASIVPYIVINDRLFTTFFPEQYARDSAQWTQGLTIAAMPLSVLNAVVLAPLWEELFFRRLLVEPLRSNRIGLVLTSIASSALWSTVHLYSWPTTVVLFFEGIFLCWLAVKLRSIWPGILVHALGNSYAMWCAAQQLQQ